MFQPRTIQEICSGNKLKNNEQWWHGPQWSSQGRLCPPEPPTAEAYIAQNNKLAVIMFTVREIQQHGSTDTFENSSWSWEKYITFTFTYLKVIAKRGKWRFTKKQLRQLGEKFCFINYRRNISLGSSHSSKGNLILIYCIQQSSSDLTD